MSSDPGWISRDLPRDPTPNILKLKTTVNRVIEKHILRKINTAKGALLKK